MADRFDAFTIQEERRAAEALAKWLGGNECDVKSLQGFYKDNPDLRDVVRGVQDGNLRGVKALCNKYTDLIGCKWCRYRRTQVLSAVTNETNPWFMRQSLLGAPSPETGSAAAKAIGAETESDAIKAIKAELERVSSELASTKEAFIKVLGLMKRDKDHDNDMDTIKSTMCEILSLFKRDIEREPERSGKRE